MSNYRSFRSLAVLSISVALLAISAQAQTKTKTKARAPAQSESQDVSQPLVQPPLQGSISSQIVLGIADQFEPLWQMSQGAIDYSGLPASLQNEPDPVDPNAPQPPRRWSEKPYQSCLKKRCEVSAMVMQGPAGYELWNMMISSASGTVGTDYGSVAGKTTVADVHTHPFTYDYEDSNPFSGTDVVEPYRLYTTIRRELFKTGYVKIVRSGRSWYTLEIEDADKALAMYQALAAAAKAKNNMTIRDYVNDIYTHTNHGTDISNIRENCVIRLIGTAAVSGVGFYRIDNATHAVAKLN